MARATAKRSSSRRHAKREQRSWPEGRALKARVKPESSVSLRKSPNASICAFVQNKAGRKGVPLTRSFEKWIGSIPDLRRYRKLVQVNILIVDAKEGRQFNRGFRQRDYATNVLSFPYDPHPREYGRLLGDLVICAPVVAREAAEQGKDLRDHYAHLTIHGALHLLGYDHETAAEAERMEALERRILAGLGIGDPY